MQGSAVTTGGHRAGQGVQPTAVGDGHVALVQLLARVTLLTGVFAAPGETDRQIFTLTEEGRDGIVCLVPASSAATAIESGAEPDGPPRP